MVSQSMTAQCESLFSVYQYCLSIVLMALLHGPLVSFSDYRTCRLFSCVTCIPCSFWTKRHANLLVNNNNNNNNLSISNCTAYTALHRLWAFRITVIDTKARFPLPITIRSTRSSPIKRSGTGLANGLGDGVDSIDRASYMITFDSQNKSSSDLV